MGKRRGLTAVLATLVSLSLFAAPVMANPEMVTETVMAAARATAVAIMGIRAITVKKETANRKITSHLNTVKIMANRIMLMPI